MVDGKWKVMVFFPHLKDIVTIVNKSHETT